MRCHCCPRNIRPIQLKHRCKKARHRFSFLIPLLLHGRQYLVDLEYRGGAWGGQGIATVQNSRCALRCHILHIVCNCSGNSREGIGVEVSNPFYKAAEVCAANLERVGRGPSKYRIRLDQELSCLARMAAMVAFVALLHVPHRTVSEIIVTFDTDCFQRGTG